MEEKKQDIDKVIRTGDPLNTDQRNNELSRHVVNHSKILQQF